MPKVLEVDGFRVYIFNPPREHGPAHVHVERAEGEVIITLPEGKQPLGIREIYNMSNRNVVLAYRLVEANAEELLERWREIHD